MGKVEMVFKEGRGKPLERKVMTVKFVQ